MKAPLWSLMAEISAVLVASQAQAALIAYDGFSYTDGASINGGTGGSGWTSDWTADASAVSQTTTVPLTYSGGTVAVNGDSRAVLAGGNFNTLVDRSFAAQNGTPVYFSFLFRYDAATGIGSDDFVHFMLNNDNAVANSGGIGKLETNNIRFGARIGGSNGGGTSSSGVNMIAATTYLMVGKISVSGTAGANYDRIDLFVNPTSNVEPGTSTVSDTADAGFSSLSHFTIRTSGVDTDDLYVFDELRIGTAFSDVVIPEPSVSGLALVGASFLLVHRRRKI